MSHISPRVRGRVVSFTFRADAGESCDECGQPIAPNERVAINSQTLKPSHVNKRKCRRPRVTS